MSSLILRTLKPGLVSHGYHKPIIPTILPKGLQAASGASYWQEGRGERLQQGPVLHHSERRGSDTSSSYNLLVFKILFNLQKFNIITLFNLLNAFLYGFSLLSGFSLILSCQTTAVFCEQPVGWLYLRQEPTPGPITQDWRGVCHVAHSMAA